VLPLPTIVVNTLGEWKHRCPEGDLDLVFPSGTGKPESHPNIVQRGLIPAWVAAGVVTGQGGAKYRGLHCLRHFYASWCINRKADGGLELPLKMVQARLGYSTLNPAGVASAKWREAGENLKPYHLIGDGVMVATVSIFWSRCSRRSGYIKGRSAD
jgi:integrase